MLEDHKRTGAYHQAILNNRRSFQDKAVLDVGTGSGILAIFAAQAGARKVYAVEATDMAKVAKRLVDSNNVRRVLHAGLQQEQVLLLVDLCLPHPTHGAFIELESNSTYVFSSLRVQAGLANV